MLNFWKDNPNIIDKLTEVKKIITSNLHTNQKEMNNILIPMIDNSGKMIRPGLLILAADFSRQSYDEKKVLKLAAIVEMLHMATLIHDDIVDNSELRRGDYTIQHKYGREYAVYIGDYIFTRCFSLLSNDYSNKNMRDLSQSISKICLGEILQYHSRFNVNSSFRNYIKIISGKTAALISLSCYIGAMESGQDEKTIRNFAKIGYYLGLAFQIKDDILDFSKNVNSNKTTRIDIINGYYTLPVIFALKSDKTNQLRTLLSDTERLNNNFEEFLSLINNFEGIEKAQEIADRYTNKAYNLLDSMSNKEQSDIFKRIIFKLTNRDY